MSDHISISILLIEDEDEDAARLEGVVAEDGAQRSWNCDG